MNEKTRELVGIAASIVGHCRPCFKYHFKKAKKLGVLAGVINEVIEFPRSICTAGDNRMYKFILKINK